MICFLMQQIYLTYDYSLYNNHIIKFQFVVKLNSYRNKKIMIKGTCIKESHVGPVQRRREHRAVS